MKIAERILVGVCRAMLCGGIATVNALPVAEIVGWSVIGFAVGALLDLFIKLISSLLGYD